MKNLYKTISRQQKVWATKRKIRFDKDGYTFSLDDNLFVPLSLQARTEFGKSRGDELGSTSRRGKMHALHSSSALVYNFFEYWRLHDIGTIAVACGATKGMSELRFEQTHPTGLRGTAPHIDVEFNGPDLIPLAIESKYTEPYQGNIINTFKESYFNKQDLWNNLSKCEKLAKKINENKIVFSSLATSQLLKHILGLSKAFPNGFSLLYLWYEIPSEYARRHTDEINLFKDHIQGEVDFRFMTYQHLFTTIKDFTDADESYKSYLFERYF